MAEVLICNPVGSGSPMELDDRTLPLTRGQLDIRRASQTTVVPARRHR
jgi:hypothetical protein